MYQETCQGRPRDVSAASFGRVGQGITMLEIAGGILIAVAVLVLLPYILRVGLYALLLAGL